MKALTLRLPIKLVGSQNIREHWAQRSKRVRNERSAVCAAVRVADKPKLPVVVTLTRISPGTVDSDNLQGCCKGVRDAVADGYDVTDRTPLIEWRYEQRKGAAKEYAVEIRIEGRTP